MAERHSRNVIEVQAWCRRCSRETMHAVSGGKIGHYTEHEPPAQSRAQLLRRRAAAQSQQRRLFPPDGTGHV